METILFLNIYMLPAAANLGLLPDFKHEISAKVLGIQQSLYA
jgi:hypothetical protein